MDGIEIKITGNTPMETLASLAAFGMHCLANKDICEAAERIYKLEAAREAEKKRQDAAAESVTAEPPATAPAAPPATPPAVPAPVQAAPPEAVPNTMPGQMAFGIPSAAPQVAPKYTVEDITRAGAEFLVAHPEHQNAMYSLLPQFGIAALSELRPEQLAPFAAAMRSLGVKL